MKTFTEKRVLPLQDLEPDKKHGLIAQIKEYLFTKDEIVFAYIHGSFIKSTSFRDIDLAIFVKNSTDFYFESDLSAELKSITSFEVEVRIINNAPVAFQMAVLRDGLLLFSRDEPLKQNLTSYRQISVLFRLQQTS